MLGLEAAEPGGDAAGLSPQELGFLCVCDAAAAAAAQVKAPRWALLLASANLGMELLGLPK